ncbi:uricase [Microplitis demolitor]|uniref:uricase n=1 Tax=Microplitis demolitor TaxID=69319 RepID=UPI00235B6ABA|nr:uricase [Microplitis demolitor]
MSKLGALADDSLSIMGKKNIHLNSRELKNNNLNDNEKNSHAWNNFKLNLVSKHDDTDEYEIGAYGYGKNNVKLLYVKREDKYRHEIHEYEVDTHLRLGSQKDYLEGDNRDIIATDSQKNTVYILAKKYGIKSPEEFGILLCAHFLYTYKHVEEVHVNIEEYPWMRHSVNGVPHNHAFIFNPQVIRHCQVTQLRNESPKIRGGLKGLRVLKTTQSSFIDFIQDDYRTLPDANDRIFSTVVSASWDFSTAKDVDFDRVWTTVKNCILENFSGPPSTGISSPSVQNTLYLAERCVLDKIDQIKSIEMRMPNKHYLDLDMSKFPKLVEGENKEVYLPVDKPAGIIYAQLNRKDVTSRL